MSTPPPHPIEALNGLLERIEPVDAEDVPLEQASGRVLAAPVVADRASPPHDVSAMDGYAVRRSDLGQRRLTIAGEVAMGAAPLPLPPGQALRIMTGACVPPEAEAIVMREDVRELDDAMELAYVTHRPVPTEVLPVVARQVWWVNEGGDLFRPLETDESTNLINQGVLGWVEKVTR